MEITEEIIRVAARGDGVTANGRYVALAAPGDSVDPSGGLIHGPHHVPPHASIFPYAVVANYSISTKTACDCS